MGDKQKYYALDDIGVVGTQDKRTVDQIKKDMDMTAQYIKTNSTGRIITLSKKSIGRLAKAK